MLLSVKELLWKPAATDWVEDMIAQPKQMAEMKAASPGVVVVRVRVKVSSNVKLRDAAWLYRAASPGAQGYVS